MWLASRGRERQQTESLAEVGNVTLEGDPAAVYLGNERRNLPVFGPGGYFWRPERNQEVLVLKAGQDGERLCVVGARCGVSGFQLAAGEVAVTNGNGSCAICLRQDGSVEITGDSMTFNGRGFMLVPEE